MTLSPALAFGSSSFSCTAPRAARVTAPFVLDPFALSLLQNIEKKLFFSNAILRGSALYQPYIEALHGLSGTTPPKDHDILVNFGRYDLFRREQARWDGKAPSDPSYLIAYLNLFHVLKNPEVRFAVPPDVNGTYFVNIGAFYKNRPVDLIVQNLTHSLYSVSHHLHDAPITGIAMNSRGDIDVHPLFHAHAQSLVYDPASVGIDPTNCQERFKKLSEKFPTLRLARPAPPPPLIPRCRPHP